MLQPVLIAPFQTGLDTDEAPYIAPIDSFTELENFHVYHGYVEKRNGSDLLGYMVHSNSNGDSSFSISSITNANPGVVTTSTNHGFSDGDQVVLNNVEGMTEVNFQRYTIANVTATTFSIVDTTTFGAYTTGGVVNLSPGLPIMGLTRYLNDNNEYELFAFDTERAAKYNSTTHTFEPIDSSTFVSEPDLFDSGANDYIWCCQWQTPDDSVNKMYFTNGKPRETQKNGILFYPTSAGNIYRIRPPISPTGTTRELVGCKLIFTLAERLVVLNTYETDGADIINYPQRARYSQAQNPGESHWREIPGGGGYLDAPTGDHIVSARALKDSIVVFFTNSVWLLRYSIGIPDAPFRWYKLNDFRACGGKMASIGYDQYVIALGQRGITATDYAQTKRIDMKISEFVNQEINSGDFQKVFCERSYAKERWWTLYPKQTTSDEGTNKGVLIYDDDSGAYSTYDFPLNVLGNTNLEYDYNWDDFIIENNLDINFQQAGNETFDSSSWQTEGEILCGGDNNGAVFALETRASDAGGPISASFTTTYWSPYKEIGKEAQMSYIDLYMDAQYNTTATIEFFKDDAEDPYGSQDIDMLPDLGFVVPINNITQGNPTVVEATGHGLTTGQTVFFYLVEGMTEINDYEMTVTVLDNNTFEVDVDSSSFTEYDTGGNVYLREFYKTKVWKRAFAGGIGYQHAIRLTTSGANAPFKLYGLKPYFKPRGKRTIN